MNRRLVIVDQEETPDYLLYYGCGLGNEIYTTQQLQGMEEVDLKNVLTIGKGDGSVVCAGQYQP